MNLLYLDLVGGISGDMTLGAMLDLGVPLETIREALAQTGLTQVTLDARQESRHSIAGVRALVGTTREDHPHRAYAEIRRMIQSSGLAGGARERALEVFARLAEAEGRVHGVPAQDVTFHEVGAWDSIADLVGVAVALEDLGVRTVYCSPVPLGAGTATGAHGVIPVPAPATLELLGGFAVVHGGPAFERTTPTGAAILAAFAKPAPQPFVYTPLKVGIGIGTREDPEVPNLLRAILGRVEAAEGYEWIRSAEANLDDANPEWIGFLVERLLAVGALDVVLVPVQMKKNRPGTQVQVLYPPHLEATVREVLFSETTTLGVRHQTLERVVLHREAATVKTPWGMVTGKVAHLGHDRRFAPEFESCAVLARSAGVALRDVYAAAQRAFDDLEKPDED